MFRGAILGSRVHNVQPLPPQPFLASLLLIHQWIKMTTHTKQTVHPKDDNTGERVKTTKRRDGQNDQVAKWSTRPTAKDIGLISQQPSTEFGSENGADALW